MTSTTRKTWPNETVEECIERVRREHGDAVAALVAADLAGPGADKRQLGRHARYSGVRQNLRVVAGRGGGRAKHSRGL